MSQLCQSDAGPKKQTSHTADEDSRSRPLGPYIWVVGSGLRINHVFSQVTFLRIYVTFFIFFSRVFLFKKTSSKTKYENIKKIPARNTEQLFFIDCDLLRMR